MPLAEDESQLSIPSTPEGTDINSQSLQLFRPEPPDVSGFYDQSPASIAPIDLSTDGNFMSSFGISGTGSSFGSLEYPQAYPSTNVSNIGIYPRTRAPTTSTVISQGKSESLSDSLSGMALPGSVEPSRELYTPFPVHLVASTDVTSPISGYDSIGSSATEPDTAANVSLPFSHPVPDWCHSSNLSSLDNMIRELASYRVYKAGSQVNEHSVTQN